MSLNTFSRARRSSLSLLFRSFHAPCALRSLRGCLRRFGSECYSTCTSHRNFLMPMKHVRCLSKIASRGLFKDEDLLFCNPFDRLQDDLLKPLLPDDNKLFSSSLEEMKEAQKVFTDSPKNPIKFLKSVISFERLPASQNPEVAFIGRSNVGKSSLLRAILHLAPNVDVRVSKKPGHTVMMNMFEVGKSLTLVDMPGYGPNMPSHFSDSVETYLSNRQQLVKTVLILDAGRGLTADDVQAVGMLESSRASYVVVLNKVDRVRPGVLVKTCLQLQKDLNECQAKGAFPQPFLLSSLSGEGLALLQTFIAYVAGAVRIKGH